MRLDKFIAALYREDAIPERSPVYQLPCDDDDTSGIVPWTSEMWRTWRRMLTVRPILACLTQAH